tara:strand:+ start:3401 stop:3616 length:216 start_codon:yes stop_codon:yes gene_type:complete
MIQEVKVEVEVAHFKIPFIQKVKNINGLEYKSECISYYITHPSDKIRKYSNDNTGLKLKSPDLMNFTINYN